MFAMLLILASPPNPPAIAPPAPKLIKSPGSCQCGGAGNCRCGADCRCGGRLPLSEVYDRAERGELVEIAVGFPPTGKQFACDAPWVTTACGLQVEKPKGFYLVSKNVNGVVEVSAMPLPKAMPAAAPQCRTVIINGKAVTVCPNAKR